jgi:hypothetical protein
MVDVGQPVVIDISGLQVPGLFVGGGVQATGVVDAIDADKHEVTVRLDDLSFRGEKLVTVPSDRVVAGARAVPQVA